MRRDGCCYGSELKLAVGTWAWQSQTTADHAASPLAEIGAAGRNLSQQVGKQAASAFVV